MCVLKFENFDWNKLSQIFINKSCRILTWTTINNRLIFNICFTFSSIVLWSNIHFINVEFFHFSSNYYQGHIHRICEFNWGQRFSLNFSLLFLNANCDAHKIYEENFCELIHFECDFFDMHVKRTTRNGGKKKTNYELCRPYIWSTFKSRGLNCQKHARFSTERL